MLAAIPTPLVRLSHLFDDRAVYAKCEHLAPSGCFKIRGALHLLNRLRHEGRTPPLVVPSMGNTALGIAVGARAFGVPVTGVVPQSIGRDKDEKLHALGVELIKVAGDCNELLSRAGEVARERGAYFVHPHLDPLWTDGYQVIVEEVLRDLPDCRSLVFPVGGGGLLMGLTEYLRHRPAGGVPFWEDEAPAELGTMAFWEGEAPAEPGTMARQEPRPPKRGHHPPAPIRLIGCEAYNFPTYARYDHARTRTIADGLVLDDPHPAVRERIAADAVDLRLVPDEEICTAMVELYRKQGLMVEPSSAITVALVRSHAEKIEGPICVILTGSNIAWEDFAHLTQLGENFHKRDGIR